MSIKEKVRRTVVGPWTGLEFEIRKVRVSAFMREVGNLPISATPTLTEQLKQFQEKLSQGADDPELENRIARFYLSHGVVRPKVFFGNEAECPEDQVHFDDLAEDVSFLVGEIAKWSFELPGLKLFFSGNGMAVAGPGGEAIRETPDGGASSGNTPESPAS